MGKAPRSLFIGNSVNRIGGNSYGWKSLMEGLANDAGAQEALKLIDEKPFTLFYEEIREAFVRKHRREKQEGSAERALKQRIADVVNEIKPGEIHPKIVQLNADHLITTNYDYTLEAALGDSPGSADGRKRETKYSLYRYRKCGGKQIWHVHGEAESPWTICLGHDHYAGYLQKIREAVISDREAKREDESEDDRGYILQSQVDYWQSGKVDSWWRLFFTGSLDIVGFGFDYTEIDLWWLIGNRARQMSASNKQPFKLGDVTFHEFVPEKGLTNRDMARLDILHSLGVHIHRIDFKKDYEQAWDKWIKWYNNSKGGNS